MSSPTYINVHPMFDPFGQTPAICVTENILQNKAVDILLLKCSDARNILYTCFHETAYPPRKIDITCCALKRIVLARNILLYTLLLDDTKGENSSLIWNIYYHFYLDEKSRNLLQVQIAKLVKLASSVTEWHASEYGKSLRFYNMMTLNLVRDHWSTYPTSAWTKSEVAQYERRFEDDLDRSCKLRKSYNLNSLILTGFNSAEPCGDLALQEISELNEKFWTHGVTGPALLQSRKHANPLVATLPSDDFTLSSGSDPLLGFHLAAAYAPVVSTSTPPRTPGKGDKLERVLQVARAQFASWSAAFRTCAARELVLRFLAGDSMAICEALEHKSWDSACSNDSYYGPDTLQTLKFDEDCATSQRAPILFDAIETCNLVNNIGALNIMTCASPLLKNNRAACIRASYRSVKSGVKDAANQLLCGDLPTISLLLGLIPVQYYTNSSAIQNASHRFLDNFVRNKTPAGFEANPVIIHSRILWRKSLGGFGEPLRRLYIKDKALAQILHGVYRIMLQHELVPKLGPGSNGRLEESRPPGLTYYHRGSFAAFLALVKANVKSDWVQMMEMLKDLMGADASLPLHAVYEAEFDAKLSLGGVQTYSHFNPFRSCDPRGDLGPFSNWYKSTMTTMVHITLAVPRSRLMLFTSMEHRKLGNPIIEGRLEATPDVANGWLHMFADVQLSFGRVCRSYGERYSEDFCIEVSPDRKGWSGSSTLLATFVVPSWILLSARKSCIVSVSIKCSMLNAAVFLPALGSGLRIFSADLHDANAVYITKGPPHLVGQPAGKSVSFTTLDMLDDEYQSLVSLRARTAGTPTKIVSLIGRLDFCTEDMKSQLYNGASVKVNTISPLESNVRLGDDVMFKVFYPAPMRMTHSKVRIGRKSGWIEISMPLANHVTGGGNASFLYPSFVHMNQKLLWNMPHINPDQLSALDCTEPATKKWMNLHVSMQMSAREQKLRDALDNRQFEYKDARFDFKESLHMMYMAYLSLRGRRSRVFRLNSSSNGNSHFVILVSCMRLDNVKKTILLDCAVIPFQKTKVFTDKILPALASLRTVLQISVNDAENGVWQNSLPAMVECCKTWKHRLNCEYDGFGKMPLSCELGEQLLCTCGNGKFPADFMPGMKEWPGIAKHAVRAVLSPCFYMPIIEKDGGVQVPAAYKKVAVSVCQGCKKKEGSNGKALQTCADCERVKYCSVACQHTDWDVHQKSCKATN